MGETKASLDKRKRERKEGEPVLPSPPRGVSNHGATRALRFGCA